MIGISSIICIVCLVNGYCSQEVDVHANITQLFIHKITPELLSWNEKGKLSYLNLLFFISLFEDVFEKELRWLIGW